MNDTSISHDMSGNMTVDTYGMDDFSIGTNDFGEALYDIGGVQMTEAQAEANAGFFEADDDYEYDHNGYDQEYDDDTLPDPILNGLHRINNVLGGGAADFVADQILGMGEDDRMSEVLAGTNMELGEIQSYVNAVCIDMAADVGMDHDTLMDELGNDINTIRSMRSSMGMSEMHQIITDAVTGDYHAAMQRWDRLRYALHSLG